MSSMTGTTAGGGKKIIKLKINAPPAAAAAAAANHPAGGGETPAAAAPPAAAPPAAAPAASVGTVGGSSAPGRKVRIRIGGGAGAAGSQPPAPPAAAAAGGEAAAAAGVQAPPPMQQQPDLQQQPQQYDASQASQQQQQQGYDAAAAAAQQYYDPAMQQQYYQQYNPAWQQQYAQYDPSMQQYDPAMMQQGGYDHVAYAQQQQQYDMYQQQQEQQGQKVKLQTRFGGAAAAAAGGEQELRYTATGRVQRAASKGIARLIAEEGGIPQDHSLAAPPSNASRHVHDYSGDSPLQERRSTRTVRSKAIDASYIDPDTMDFEGQEWVLPDEPQPKPDKPKREPRPKKPRVERPASDAAAGGAGGAGGRGVYADDGDDFEDEVDLTMEDDAADEDFDLEMEGEEALEGKVRRSGSSRSAAAAAAAAASQRPRQSSRRAAAAGVAAAVRAAAAAGEGGYAADAAGAAALPASSAGLAHSPSPPVQPSAGGSSRGGGGGRKRAGSSGRGSSRAPGSDDDDYEDLTDEESDEGLTAWGVGGDDDDDAFGGMVLGGGYTQSDYSSLPLKPDHYNRPLWVCSDGRIFLETYSPIYKQAYDFLIAIAEPVCRPESIHEYQLTPQSLYAAVSVGLDQQTILSVLDKLSKVKLSSQLRRFIEGSTRSYGKVKLVLKHNRFWVETSDTKVLDKLLHNSVIRAARAWDTPGADERGLVRRAAIKEHAAARLAKLTLAAAAEGAQAQDADQGTQTAAAAAPPPAPAAVAPTPAAPAVGGGGRLNNPLDDSGSESDPEDFTAVTRRRQSAAEAAAEAADPWQASADAAEAAANAGSAEPTAASPPAAAAGGDGAATTTNGAATAAATAAADNSDDDSDGLPVVGGRRRRQLAASTAAAAVEDDVSDMSELDEADLEAAANAEEGADAMQVDAATQQQQQQQPVRRGRLAATAAVAAAAEAAGGDGAQALLGLQDGAGAAGYEDVEEEEDPEREVIAFEIKAADVEKVKKECLPGSSGLDCPLLEEYDFAHDTANKGLDIHLKRGVELRPYQEKSLSKMFGNGRARSGIIVLPCGAGKSLVGVAAAARVKKPTLVLCTSSVSVDQWAHQFTLWTNLDEDNVVKFVAGSGNDAQGEANRERLKEPCVCVTTFNMIAHKGKRSAYGEEMMRMLSSREWGLLVLDEVHVVPARMFRQVIAIVKAHCKLGLTATLVREDELIGDLNFLIGPKMYEANWLDLTRSGHIANVQCVEVWCPMTKEFITEYLERESKNDSIKQLLYVMNPNKFMVCQFLIDWHERVRGDKVIVFSDNVWALETYARALGKPYIYGKTSHLERTQVLAAFKRSRDVNTVFLSKVGDNSLDIPEANVLIQISSHAGSRRQEAQRLGRILRAKKGKPGSSQEEEFSAYFYTLVSRDTQEMYYSAKRQQFLVDQGYAFKVLPNLHVQAQHEEFIKYRSQAEQLMLLNQVINSKELAESLARECGKNKDEAGDKHDLVARQGTWGRGKGRKVGARSMAHASGGSEFVYNEWQRGKAMVSGPQGAVARQEREARTKKMRQRLAT